MLAFNECIFICCQQDASVGCWFFFVGRSHLKSLWTNDIACIWSVLGWALTILGIWSKCFASPVPMDGPRRIERDYCNTWELHFIKLFSLVWFGGNSSMWWLALRTWLARGLMSFGGKFGGMFSFCCTDFGLLNVFTCSIRELFNRLKISNRRVGFVR